MSYLSEIERLADELTQPHVVPEKVRTGWTKSRNPIYTTHYVSVPGLLVQLEELMEPSFANKAFRNADREFFYEKSTTKPGNLTTGLHARRQTTLIDSPAPLNMEALSRLHAIEFGERQLCDDGSVAVLSWGVRDWVTYLRQPQTTSVVGAVLQLASYAPRLDDASACDLAVAMRHWHGLCFGLVVRV